MSEDGCIFALVLVLYIGLLFAAPWLFLLLWDVIQPAFILPALSYWQAFAILFLAQLIKRLT